MGEFIVTTREDIDKLVEKRKGETKLGETVQTIDNTDWESALSRSSAKFVLFGIPENIGLTASQRTAATHTFWQPVLSAILNLQDTNALKGDCLMVLGAFDFNAKMADAGQADLESVKELVGYVDDTVFPFVQKIIALGKIPIVIGGGHNNCYPLLKGASEAKRSSVNCINLDTKSDFGPMSGRSSENGFRYAHRQGYLKKYAVVGLHENHNPQEIMDELMDDPDLCFSLYEDIFIREKLSFYEAVNFAIARTGKPATLEIDMNSIESNDTPSRITPLYARKFVNWCTREMNPLYLHIAEGVGELPGGQTDVSKAQMAAYLVTDFIKAYKKK